MKRWGIILMELILVVLFIGADHCNNMNTIKDYFKETDASLIKLTVSAWAEVEPSGRSYQSVSEDILDLLGHEGNLEAFDDGEEKTIKYKEQDTQLEIKCRNIKNDNRIYASVELSQTSGQMNINKVRRHIERVFSKFNTTPSFSVLMSGSYDYVMTDGQMKSLASKVFRTMSARYVDGMADGALVSVCGYDPSVDTRMTVCESGTDKIINVNLAIRKSPSSDCTYIWIANPIITTEY